jgi:RecB family exonuclease
MPPERFSHSSLASWRRCRYRYWLSYIKNYEARPGLGQFRGTTGHAGLAAWYTNGGDDEKAIQVASDTLQTIEIVNHLDMSKDWEDIKMILTRYFAWARRNDNFKVLAIEKEYEIELADIKLMGYIDGIVEQGGSVYILEHKFVKQARVNHVTLDMQISIYMLAAHKLGYNPYGTFYNIIRMGDKGIAEKQPVLRTVAYRNSEGLDVIEKELENQMIELKRFNEEGSKFLRLYRNPTRDCSWDCSFYPVCLSLNDSGEAESVLRTMTQVDRYKPDPEKGEIDDGG